MHCCYLLDDGQGQSSFQKAAAQGGEKPRSYGWGLATRARARAHDVGSTRAAEVVVETRSHTVSHEVCVWG